MLLVANDYSGKLSGGRESLSALNEDLLREIFLENFSAFRFKGDKNNSALSLFRSTLGILDGINHDILSHIDAILKTRSYKYVFIDGSNLGYIAWYIKKKYPLMVVYVYFHNVEFKFYWDKFINHKTIKNLILCFINFLAEFYSVKWADKTICLTVKDSEILKKVFNYHADYIFPLCIKNTFVNQDVRRKIKGIDNLNSKKYALFVGSAFYSNINGIRWFVKNVLPGIALDLVIIGNGFEEHKREFERYKNISVNGRVEDLGAAYFDAECVVAPIFDGSGMKTKVAEALMHGKIVVGTREAFIGYELLAEDNKRICNTADDFINMLNNISLNSGKNGLKSREIRESYLKLYSYEAGKKRFNSVFR